MDSRNRFHTAGTYWTVRAEHIAVLLVCTGLGLWNIMEMNWWRAIFAFWIIDVIGYLPGAVAFRRKKDQQISHWYHNIYNICHTYLVTGTGVAIWAYCIGGFEWAMLAVPFHLSIDRGIFGNTLKPAVLGFEPTEHSDEVILRALGRDKELRAANIEELVPREVLTDALEHPSGYLALSSRNAVFVMDGVPGLISYRLQGKHLWLFGGVHARPEHAGDLLDGFLSFAAERRLRVAAVQVRQAQVELFASRGFTVNQLGTTFAVTLEDYSFGGGPKMQLRNKIQRAKKLGLKVVELGKDVPRDAEWFQKIEDISANWVAAKGKKELDFMTGELGKAEDHDRRIFLVVDAEGKAWAFISYVPVWGRERPGYLHDLTRKLPDAPPGAMELCNAEAITRFKAEGVKHLHFGFTPFLIDPKEGKAGSWLVNYFIQLLRKYGARIYPADSQAAYKQKWGTNFMEREYVAAQSLSLRAVYDLLALTRSI
jgi:phosphatidylglycerol lysyltransferase